MCIIGKEEEEEEDIFVSTFAFTQWLCPRIFSGGGRISLFSYAPESCLLASYF